VKGIEEQLAAAKLTISELEKKANGKASQAEVAKAKEAPESEEQRIKPAGSSGKNVWISGKGKDTGRRAAKAYFAAHFESSSDEEW
jgi:hypothetical protein